MIEDDQVHIGCLNVRTMLALDGSAFLTQSVMSGKPGDDDAEAVKGSSEEVPSCCGQGFNQVFVPGTAMYTSMVSGTNAWCRKLTSWLDVIGAEGVAE